PDNALPWLYGTARRLVANELRRRHRQHRLDERVATNTETASPDHADTVTDRLRVRAALAELSERDREVLRLAQWERLDAADGAKVLDRLQGAPAPSPTTPGRAARRRRHRPVRADRPRRIVMIDTLLRDADPARELTADPSSPAARAMLAAIVSRPRLPQRRNHRARRRVVIGGVLAGAAATVALAAPMPWDGGGSGPGSSAYAVNTEADGTVKITIRWSELSDVAK